MESRYNVGSGGASFFVSKKSKKRHIPDLDMNHNPVWQVLTDNNFPKKKSSGKKKKKKVSESSIDDDLQQIFDELEEKKEFEKAFKNKQKKKKNRKYELSLFKVIVGILVLLIVGIVGTVIVKYDRYTVPTNSMTSTLEKNNQVLFKSNLPISRFSVVLVEKEGKKDVLRVVGMPGDDIKMSNDTLQVNGSIYEESYLKNNFVNFKYQEGNARKVYTSNFDMKHIVGQKEELSNIPERKYYLLGDNRQKVTDSRKVGLYDESDIKGVAVMKITPIKEIGTIQ